MPGSRASSFQRQATPPPRPVIPRETKSDQAKPSDTVWSKVGRPSGAARVPASLALQHPRGTRRDVSRKRNKPSPPTRCAIRRNRAKSSKGITARTRSESPNQSKNLANRERFFARTSQPTCPNPKHPPTGHNYPKKQRSQRTRASFSVRLTYAVVTSLLLATNSRALCVYFFSAAVRPSHLSQILPNSSALSLVMMSTCARTVVLAGFSPYAALLSSMRTLS